MRIDKLAATLLILCSITLTPACRLPSGITERSEQFVTRVEETIAQTDQPELSTSTPPVVQSFTDVWLGPHTPVEVVNSPSSRPESLTRHIELNFVESTSLVELSRQIADTIEVPILVSADIETAELPNINWSGPAADALDHITSRLGYSWRTRRDGIEVFHTELGMWTLFAPGIEAQWQASVGLSGSIQGGSGGSDLQAHDQVVLSLDTSIFWDEIEAAVSSLLTEFGKADINRHSGELTVIDTPVALRRIADWVAIKNQDLTTQVIVNFDLYEIYRKEDASAGFNLAGIIQNAFGKSAAAVQFDDDDAGGFVGIQLSHNPSGTTDTSDIELILRKSEGVERVAKLTSTVIRGLNGLPVPVFFGDETSYLQRRDVVNSEGSTSVRLVPGKVQDGIAINMVPRILPDSNRMMLNLTVRTTRIKEISRFPVNAGPNDPVIQLPNLESRSILLPVVLNSGELLFVAGLDTFRTDDTKSKSILRKNSAAELDHTSLVLLITPYIIRPALEYSGQQQWSPQNDNSSIL